MSNGVLTKRNVLVHPEQRTQGILGGFAITPASGLNPTVIKGAVVGPMGRRAITDADLDAIGPNGDGLVSDDDTTALFYSISGDNVYSNTDGVKANSEDILLGYIVAASTNITTWIPGDIANLNSIKLPGLSVASTGDKVQFTYRVGNEGKKLIAAEIVPLTNITTTAPVISIQKISRIDGTNTVLAVFTGATATADLDAVTNVIYSKFSESELKAAANYVANGDQIVIEVTTAAAAGTCDLILHFGGAL